MKEAQRRITWHNGEFFKFLIFVIYNWDCKVEDEVSRSRSTHRRNEKSIHNFNWKCGRKTWRNGCLGKLWHSWEHSTTTEFYFRIGPVWDLDNPALNCRSLWNTENFLIAVQVLYFHDGLCFIVSAVFYGINVCTYILLDPCTVVHFQVNRQIVLFSIFIFHVDWCDIKRVFDYVCIIYIYICVCMCVSVISVEWPCAVGWTTSWGFLIWGLYT